MMGSLYFQKERRRPATIDPRVLNPPATFSRIDLQEVSQLLPGWDTILTDTFAPLNDQNNVQA
jgi:hypothetical protein